MTDPIDGIDIRYHHVAFSVPDLEASIRWYRETLGFEAEWRRRVASVPADVAMLRRGVLRVELFQPEHAAPLPAARSDVQEDLRTHGTKHVAFAVRDMAAAVAELRRRHVDIVHHGTGPFAAFAFFRDNSGNLIELFEQLELWDANKGA
jgi:methylmalonyl-CoA/ethylmalonyl-CoA epimerase